MLVSEKKIDLKTKSITRNKEKDFIVIKGSIHQKNRTSINTYAVKQQHTKIHEQKNGQK